jgi:beta-lactamase regulating signal transducer with metallopeptidase domain
MNVDFGGMVMQWVAAIGERRDVWFAVADGVLKATLLLGVALLLDVVLRRRAVLCATMWNATLLGLLGLAVAEATLPKSDLLQRWMPTATAMRTADERAVETVVAPLPLAVVETPIPVPTFVAPPPELVTAPEVILPSEAAPVGTAPPSVENNVLAFSVAEAAAASQPASAWLTWANGIAAAVVIYLIGWTIAVWRLAAGLRAVAKLRRASVAPADDDWHRRLAKWAEKLDLRRTIELSVSDAVNVPLVVGARRPMIALPTDVADQAEGASRDAVLVHELTHVARCDYAWQLLFRGLQTVLWFHPLVWIAGRRIDFVRERVCDAFTVHGLGSVEQYADALLEMAGRLAKRCSLSLGLAVVRSTKLGERLAAIHEHGGDGRYVASRWGRMLAAAAALGGAALLGHTGVTPTFAEVSPQVDEASQIMAELETSIVLIQQDAAARINAHRLNAVTALQAMQNEYSRAAKLDEAVAIRDAVRRLQAARADSTRRSGASIPRSTIEELSVDMSTNRESLPYVEKNPHVEQVTDPTTAEFAAGNSVTLSELADLSRLNLFARPATSVLELQKIMEQAGVFRDERRVIAENLLDRLMTLFSRYEVLSISRGARHPELVELQTQISEVALTIYGLCEYASADPSSTPTAAPSSQPTDRQDPLRADQDPNKAR